MTYEQKAIRACVDYARLSGEIKRLTRTIGDALSGCLGVDGHLKLPANWLLDGEAMARQEADETHVKRVYRGEVVDSYPEPYLRHYSGAELIEQLSVCPHCLSAHEAIQARKAARRSLGAAKRTITVIGRKALKEPA